MENSSAIFYAMGGWAEERMGEGVIAHETVHQWFGDSVTPAAWSHLWVSEGLAPEQLEGAPIDERSDLFGLLNTNSYPKGGWILHMLRVKIGEEAFWKGIRAYYAAHENGVADTEDVRRAMEEASGQDLESFFEQWAYSPGFPKLAVSVAQDGEETVITVDQVQSEEWPTFTDSRLEMDVQWASGEVDRHGLWLTSRSDELRIPSRGEVGNVVLDPAVMLLMEAVETSP